MPQSNGHDTTATALTTEGEVLGDLRELAAKAQQPVTVLEKVRDPDASFEQKSHTLMLEAVDKITNQWVAEMVALRNNSQVIEQMVIEQASRVKGEMTKLHLLGVQAMRETQRGHEVLEHLGQEIEAMTEERRATH